MRLSEQRQLLRGIMAIRATRETGYRWLRAHLDELTSGAEGIFFSSRMPQLLGRFALSQIDENRRDLSIFATEIDAIDNVGLVFALGQQRCFTV